MISLQKIVPHLWFDRNAEDAVDFYCSVFKDARVLNRKYYADAGFEIHKMPAGTLMTVTFELHGQQFVALNGGPVFQFNEAISFIINCDDQSEIDYYWDRLSEGGDPGAQRCGWLKDRFGVCWQVVPRSMEQLLPEENQAQAERVMNALLQMKKINLAALEMAAGNPEDAPMTV